MIQALAKPLPRLFGGAADLSESNLTDVKGEGSFEADDPGRNLRFGVREHAMGGIANGIAYHGGFIPYAGTFLTFSDYMRGSVRLAALSGLHVVYVWTHDSVGLGEDGPTHQPVEHYAALRAIPNLWFVRPGDANEAAAAWAVAIRRGLDDPSGPVALSLTRQKLPTLAGTAEKARDGVARGGYVLREAIGGAPRIILIGTGSELQLAYRAAEALEARRRPGARRLAPLLGAVRAAGRGLPRVGAAAVASAPASPSRPASRSAGSAGSATRARSSGSTTSARRRRPGRSSSGSGSRSIASPASPATCSRATVRGRSRDARARATCPRRAAAIRRSSHGESGVGRTSSTDPGHS